MLDLINKLFIKTPTFFYFLNQCFFIKLKFIEFYYINYIIIKKIIRKNLKN